MKQKRKTAKHYKIVCNETQEEYHNIKETVQFLMSLPKGSKSSYNSVRVRLTNHLNRTSTGFKAASIYGLTFIRRKHE